MTAIIAAVVVVAVVTATKVLVSINPISSQFRLPLLLTRFNLHEQ